MSTAAENTAARLPVRDVLLLVLLAFDAVVLAVLELMYLYVYLTVPVLGTIPFPVTTAVAAVTTPLLVLTAGRIGGSVRTAGIGLVVWFLTMIVLGLLGPGGDVLLPGDWRSMLLLVAGAIPGAIALGMTMAREAASQRGTTKDQRRSTNRAT